MFPKYKVSLPTSAFNARRNLKGRALTQYKRELERTVKPDVQKQVDDLLGADPGPVKLPFEFATDKSRAAYFATNGFGKGVPYRRTDALRTSWRVDLTTRLNQNFIVIVNPKKYARFVYGSRDQRQVPGHANTGWARDFDTAVGLIQEYAVTLVTSVWRDAVIAAMAVH